jgi:hypothetical protein
VKDQPTVLKSQEEAEPPQEQEHVAVMGGGWISCTVTKQTFKSLLSHH